MDNITASISKLPALADYAAQMGMFLLIEGKSGIGKTSAARVIADHRGISHDRIYIVNLSGNGPQESVGYGIPDPTTRDMWFSCPEIWPTVERIGDDKALLVLDEFSDWDPQVQSLLRSLESITSEAKVGTHTMGPNVEVVICANRRSDGSRSSRTLEAPFVARCMQVTVEPTLSDWLEWGAENGYGASGHYAFMKFACGGSDSERHFAPDPTLPWSGEAYATPRGHEAACKATLPDAPVDNEPALQQLALQGVLGTETGQASHVFIQTLKDLLPVVKGIKAGTESLPTDRMTQYSVALAAFRLLRRDISNDPSAAVVSGSADWFIDRVLLPAPAEIAQWLFDLGIRDGSVPLDMHSKAGELQALGA